MDYKTDTSLTLIGTMDSAAKRLSTRRVPVANPRSNIHVRVLLTIVCRSMLSMRMFSRRLASSFDPICETCDFWIRQRGQRHSARYFIVARMTLKYEMGFKQVKV